MAKNVLMRIEDYGTVIYKCYTGSRAYGTNITEEKAKEMAAKQGGDWKDYVSDVDIRGIFIPHREYYLGNNKIDEYRDPHEEDTVYFTLEKFLRLALEGNPNILEQLFVEEEDMIYAHPLGLLLRKLGIEFLSRNCYSKYVSYSMSQLKKMQPQDDGLQRNKKRQQIIEFVAANHGVKYDSKNASHLIRLLRTGIEILNERKLLVKRPDAPELLEIRNGSLSLDDLKKMVDDLDEAITIAMENSTIPNVPDFEKINTWAMYAVDTIHGEDPSVGVFQGSTLRFLPVEYEMVDKTTLFLVSNPLVRKISSSDAQGMCIPYKDWFTGLRKFSEFKFESTTIEHIHKFVKDVRACDPRHIDVIYAPEEKFILKHSMADEFFQVLRTLPTTKSAYYSAYGFITGNLKPMLHWEKLKKEHNELREAVAAAKAIKSEVWDERFAEWERKSETNSQTFNKKMDAHYALAIGVSNETELEPWKESLHQLELSYRESLRELNVEKTRLTKEFDQWKTLSQKKGQMPVYPPMEKMNNVEASMVGKFSYNTVMAANMTHIVRMYIELLTTGTIVNSRAYESEMYAILHGRYKTFDEFHTFINERLEDLTEARNASALGNHNYEKLQEWLIDYINRYHQQL